MLFNPFFIDQHSQNDLEMAAPSISKTLAEASKKAVRLYRHSLKAIPTVVKMYQLEYTPAHMKRQIRKEFESHKVSLFHMRDSSFAKEVKQPEVVDMLVFRGRLELEETVKIFKTKAHVAKLFAPPTEVSSAVPVPVAGYIQTQFDFTIPSYVEQKFKEVKERNFIKSDFKSG
jgi:NADH dehydrogenase (ubiquinone) 1 alpha subcomplex subunit 6